MYDAEESSQWGSEIFSENISEKALLTLPDTDLLGGNCVNEVENGEIKNVEDEPGEANNPESPLELIVEIVPKNRIPCEFCGKHFPSRFSVMRHIKINCEKNKPFGCKDCGRRFSEQSNLEKHIMTFHVNESPLSCYICGKAFVNRCSYKRHMETHILGKLFKCYYCEKGFTRKGNLKLHMVTHTEGSPYMCQNCGRNFTWKRSLVEHIKTCGNDEGKLSKLK